MFLELRLLEKQEKGNNFASFVHWNEEKNLKKWSKIVLLVVKATGK